MHSHLVAVEVSVEGGADQRVELDGLALDEHGLERLDAQAMERGRAVQQHGMFADDFLEDVPHFRTFALDHALGSLDGAGLATDLELREDERLEQFERHLLGQTALVQTQRRTHHDDRTTGVVDTLAEQVLTEPALLALDHVGERLQRALVGSRDGAATTTVVEQRIHRFLQHALFVAHDDVWRAQFKQAAQTVVAVDNATVEVVQVGGGEAAAIQRNERAQIRREHRQDGEYHPLGLVTGVHEGLDELQALGQTLDLGLRRGGGHVLADAHHFFRQIHCLQQFMDGFGTHEGTEIVAMGLNGL